MKFHRLRFKTVMRLDTHSKMLRIFRVIWERGQVGDGNGYSAKASLALSPRLFLFALGHWDCVLVLFGVRFHYKRAYGGHIV